MGRRLTGYKMADHIELESALDDWCTDSAGAEATYGSPSTWWAPPARLAFILTRAQFTSSTHPVHNRTSPQAQHRLTTPHLGTRQK